MANNLLKHVESKQKKSKGIIIAHNGHLLKLYYKKEPFMLGAYIHQKLINEYCVIIQDVKKGQFVSTYSNGEINTIDTHLDERHIAHRKKLSTNCLISAKSLPNKIRVNNHGAVNDNNIRTSIIKRSLYNYLYIHPQSNLRVVFSCN